MSKKNIAVIVGSIRQDSINRKLAEALVKSAPEDLDFNWIEIADLPLYNQDEDDSPAESVQRLKKEIKAADGLIFVTPEYNRSMPGVLKNALDHASRPYGKSVWAKKPAGVLGASVGPLGSSMAQQHLRNVLAYLDVPTMGQPEVFVTVGKDTFDENGDVATPALQKLLRSWMETYVAWVDTHQK